MSPSRTAATRRRRLRAARQRELHAAVLPAGIGSPHTGHAGREPSTGLRSPHVRGWDVSGRLLYSAGESASVTSTTERPSASRDIATLAMGNVRFQVTGSPPTCTGRAAAGRVREAR